MSGAQAKQELAEARNTITQFRKNQAPFKRQRRKGWNTATIMGMTHVDMSSKEPVKT